MTFARTAHTSCQFLADSRTNRSIAPLFEVINKTEESLSTQFMPSVWVLFSVSLLTAADEREHPSWSQLALVFFLQSVNLLLIRFHTVSPADSSGPQSRSLTWTPLVRTTADWPGSLLWDRLYYGAHCSPLLTYSSWRRRWERSPPPAAAASLWHSYGTDSCSMRTYTKRRVQCIWWRSCLSQSDPPCCCCKCQTPASCCERLLDGEMWRWRWRMRQRGKEKKQNSVEQNDIKV